MKLKTQRDYEYGLYDEKSKKRVIKQIEIALKGVKHHKNDNNLNLRRNKIKLIKRLVQLSRWKSLMNERKSFMNELQTS